MKSAVEKLNVDAVHPSTGRKLPRGAEPVLRKRPDLVRRFGDIEWDLSETDFHEGRPSSQTRINWSDIIKNHRNWLLTCRELCWHRLNTQLVDHKPVSIYSAIKEQERLKRFLRWMAIYYPEAYAPDLVEQRHMHEYRMWLANHGEEDRIETSGANRRSGTTIDPHTVWSYLIPIHALDLYRGYLTVPLTFRPYDGRLNAAMLGFTRAKVENETQPLPDEVITVLIDGAHRYIKHYAPTILQMSDETRAFWVSGKEKFPGWRFYAEPCPETGIDWLPKMTGAPHHYFREEFGHLVGACLIIILYLSGMRPGEAANLEENCLDQPVDRATGLRDRWQIEGIPLKKRKKGKDGKPVKVAWVVPEIVADAVDILSACFAPYRAIHHSQALILSKDALRPARDPNKMLKRVSRRGFPIGVNAVNDLINKFYERARVQWEERRKDDPKLVEAPEYHIKPQQFRRTLARHIARQPFGIIAGRLHYNHVTTAVFEGYAGSASDTFALDVEDERVMAGIDILEEMRSDARLGFQAGNSAKRVLGEWEIARNAGRPVGTIDPSGSGLVADNSVRRLAETVHVGALNYCVFNVSSALCLSDSQKHDEAAPAISMCSPDKCGNAVIAPCHMPKWQALKDEVDRLLPIARTAPQRKSLKAQAKRYESVIEKANGK